MVEIIVILLYVVVRIDKRFWVPDHSKKAGDYSRGHAAFDTEKVDKNANGNGDGEGRGDGEGGLGNMIMPEEEVFDDMSPEEVAQKDLAAEKDVDVEKKGEGPNA